MLSRARAYVELTKPGILQLLVLTTVCAMFVGQRGVPPLELMVWTLLGTLFVCGSANTCNMIWDRDIDHLMARTAHRPLVTDRTTVRGAKLFALTTGIGGLAILYFLVNPLAALMGLCGHVFYVVIYTMILKRRTPQNIVIGGAAGAFPAFIGYAAVTGTIDLAAWLLFGIVFLWTPPHFWALALYKKIDYGKANVPMMPVVHGALSTKRQMLFYMLLLLACSAAFIWIAPMGPVYAVSAIVLGLIFTYCCIRTLYDVSESDRWARRTFAFSIVYLGLLFGAMSADAILTEPLIPNSHNTIEQTDAASHAVAATPHELAQLH